MTISTERNEIDYPPKWVGAIYFSTAICGSKLKRSKHSRDFYNTWSTVRNLNPKLMTNWRRDVTKGIQPRFVYQSSFPDYYKPMED
jgi:hypothetical protein